MNTSQDRHHSVTTLFLFTILISAFLFTNGLARETDIPDTSFVIKPPVIYDAYDTKNDHGRSITVVWEPAVVDSSFPGIGYRIMRSRSESGPFDSVAFASIGDYKFIDRNEFGTGEDPNGVFDGVDYYYKIDILDSEVSSNILGPVQSSGQWFHSGKTATFVVALLFCLVVLTVLRIAKHGRELYIRPLSGINAIDDAIGRATEMGKPILVVPGLGVASDVATIAAMTILERVAKQSAEYQSRVIVPCYYPETMIVAQEVVRSAYLDAGRPDLYNEKEVFFITQEQFPYAAAVNGIMLRDKPATNFFLGKFYAESLMLAETGYEAGAIQIGGTDEAIQIPFFVAACDYTLIGEELYAASAYLSQDPLKLGILKAQDIGKAAIVIFLIAGLIAASVFGSDFFIRLLDVTVN